MKKLLLFMFFVCVGGYGQALMSSTDLKLKRPTDKQQVLLGRNSSSQLFVFVADKEKAMLLHYNAAVFLLDSISGARPSREYEFMAGYGFDRNNKPSVFWADNDFTKIARLTYDLTTKTAQQANFTFDYSKETLLGSFTQDDRFALLTFDDEKSNLYYYTFEDLSPTKHTLAFNDVSFSVRNSKTLTLSKLLEKYPAQFMSPDMLNPLNIAVAPVKIFNSKNRLWLTVDTDSNQTHLFEVNLSDYTVVEKKFLQPDMGPDADMSNSFYLDGKLYQMKVSETTLALQSYDVSKGTLFKTYKQTADDSLYINNAPLFSQTGRQRPTEIKNFRKFLRRLSNADCGLSVYKTPHDVLLTVGGSRNVASTGGIIAGIALGTAVIAGGGGYISGDFFDDSAPQLLFFDSLFDGQFSHNNYQTEPLADDFLAQFLAEHDEVSAQSFIRNGYYYILCYYDNTTKQVRLRRFTDVKPE